MTETPFSTPGAARVSRVWAAAGLAVSAAAMALAPDWRWMTAAAVPAVVAALSIWAMRRPVRWLAGFAAATLLLPPLPFGFGNSGPHPSLLFAAAGLACGLARRGEWRLSRSGLATAAWLLPPTISISSLFAFAFLGAAAGAASLVRVGLLSISFYVLLDVAYGPISASRFDPRRAVRLLFALAAASCLFALVDFYFQFRPPAGFSEQYVWLSSGVYRRAQGVFYDSGALGGFCVFFLVGAAALALRPHLRKTLLSAWMLGLGIVLLEVAMLFSLSRSALLSLVAALAALCWIQRRDIVWPRAAAWGAAAALGGTLLAYVLFPSYVDSYFGRLSETVARGATDPEEVLGERLVSWRVLLGFLAGHPERLLFGVGYKTLPYTAAVGRSIVADNNYVSVLVETGLAGLAAWTFFFAALFRTAYRATRSSNPLASFLGAWSLCFWVGQLFQMAFADLLTYWRVLPVYLGVLALAARLTDNCHAGKPLPHGRGSKSAHGRDRAAGVSLRARTLTGAALSLLYGWRKTALVLFPQDTLLACREARKAERGP